MTASGEERVPGLNELSAIVHGASERERTDLAALQVAHLLAGEQNETSASRLANLLDIRPDLRPKAEEQADEEHARKPSTTSGYIAGMASGNPHNPALDAYDF